MNHIYKIISSLFFSIVILVNAIPAMAAYSEVGEGKANTEVYLTVDNNNVRVGVPTTLIIDGTPNSNGEYVSNYTVNAYGDIAGTQKLCVGPIEKDIEITQEGKATEKAVMQQDKVAFTSDEIKEGTSTIGTVTAKALTAGSWEAQTTFNITIVDYSKTPTIPDESEANYIYVSPTGNNETGDGSKDNPYSSIWYANSTITDNSLDNKYVIKVADGEYNDLETIYNDSNTEDSYWGIIAKDYVYYLGNTEQPENVIINWDAAKGFEDISLLNENIDRTEIFHIFESTETVISGFTMNATNTLRTLHIEQATTGVDRASNYVIENCNINYYGNTETTKKYSNVIGCGSNNGEFGLFKNCNITTYNANYPAKIYDVHSNNANKTGEAGARIIFENCTFNAPNEKGDNKPMIRSQGTDSQTDSKAYIYLIGCEGTNADGSCGILLNNTNDNKYHIFAWCDSNPMDYNNMKYFNDFDDKNYEVIEYAGKNVIAVTNLFVKPDTQYKIEVSEGYLIQSIQQYKQYKYDDNNSLASAKVYNSASVLLDTTNDTETVTGIRIIIKRTDNAPLTSEDLSKVTVRIKEV